MKANHSHCAHEVYDGDRDRLLLSMFIPADQREAFFTLYALNIELARIRLLVSEEMIGHIRYAWWREAIEDLYAGKPARGQPVLESLAPLIRSGDLPASVLMPLPEAYCEHFPGSPPKLDELLKNISLTLIRARCPQAQARWEKAYDIIKGHRLRYGQRRYPWLIFRLLIAGR